jgi:erythromycin esterase
MIQSDGAPAAIPEVIDWIRKNAVSLNSVAAGAGFGDLAPVREWFRGARIVGLGESTHGTREFFQLKHRILEFLVSELGFTHFAIEADFAQSLVINRYVLAGEGDSRHSLNSLRYWDCAEVLGLIEWMRNWNDSHKRKIHFFGVDMQSTASAIFVLDYLQRFHAETYERFRDALQILTVDANSYSVESWIGIPGSEKDRARAAVEALADGMDSLAQESGGNQLEWDAARLHVKMLWQYVQLTRDLSDERQQATRDRLMADNLAAMLGTYGPDAKAVFWAHNGHVQLNAAGPWGNSSPPAGQYLRERFGNEYVAVGFAFDHGSFEAPDQQFKKHSWTVASVPNTLDATLAEAGPPVFALSLKAVPEEVADWFAQAPRSRSIGGGFDPSWDESLWTSADPRLLFDAIMFVQETSAARPNPGVYEFELRREETAPLEEFVNLDFNAGVQGWQMRQQPQVGAYRIEVVSDRSRQALEIFRNEALWPWDNCVLWQTASAAAWRGRRITLKCPVSMQIAHHGSSAQVALRILKERPKESGSNWQHVVRELKERSWMNRLVWHRVATRAAETRELSLTVDVSESADTIGLTLLVAGDGLARFGPITITAIDNAAPSDAGNSVTPRPSARA